MDRTPCYNTLAANSHLDEIDRGAAVLDDLHAELTNDMQRALAGLQSHVPGYVSNGTREREVLQSAADEVYATLDYSEVMGALMLVLKDSACPKVADLRRLVIKRYVNETADTLADVRGAYQ